MSAEAPLYQPVNHVFVDLENVKTIDAAVVKVLAEMKKAKLIAVDGKGAVSYQL